MKTNKLIKEIKSVFKPPKKKYYLGKLHYGTPLFFSKSPIAIICTPLYWKDKFGSPRFEWCPAFYIFFFKWQFCIFWEAPDGDNDKYYEMILWYLHYCNKDIVKAEETWGWIDYNTKQSTWNKDYLL